ncbi:MAG: DUF2797 domain-containing protein [Candidatus Nanohaloarchaea archaeon]
MRAIVKVAWTPDPVLVLASPDGFDRVPLETGRELEYEIGKERRCTGYHRDMGEHVPCPGFRELETGDQCRECREKDIYTGWRTGKASPGFDAEYSVYLAQAGEKVKVGVARTGRLEERWLEQGADYAVEVFSELTGDGALEREKEISSEGIPERIRKEHKLEAAEPRLSGLMDEHGLSGEVRSINAEKEFRAKTVDRTGLLPDIEHVKGQMISDGRRAVAFTSGKVLKPAEQTGLTQF